MLHVLAGLILEQVQQVFAFAGLFLVYDGLEDLGFCRLIP